MKAALDRIEGINLAEETSKPRKAFNINPGIRGHGRTGKQPKRHRDDAAELTT